MTPNVRISKLEYEEIRKLFLKHYGIVLSDDISPVADSKLSGLFEKYNIKSFNSAERPWSADPGNRLLLEMLDILTVNHTSFFRENSHFQFLRDVVLPELNVAQNDGLIDLRFWSAACSTGEEAYSILFTMREYFGEKYHKLDGGVLATDIALSSLRKAKAGVYRKEKLEKLPDFAKRYFTKSSALEHMVHPDIRDDVLFRWLNLHADQFQFKQQYHVIFCRNAMLYFSQESRAILLKRLHDVLLSGGYLFIGHSETTTAIPPGLKQVAPAIFQKTKSNSQ